MDTVSDSESELRQKVLDLCEIFHPKPIIVRTDAFPDSFLVGKQYHHSNRRAVFESISFRYNPDNPLVIQTKLKQERQGRRKEGQQLTPEEEFLRRMQIMFMMLPFMTARHLHMTAKSWGYDTYEEYLQKTNEIYTKARKAAGDNNREEADRLARQELDKRYYEHGGKGSYVELINPKKTLYKTTILFRVIGKRNYMVSKYLGYYLRQVGASTPVISNSIPDATEHIGPYEF